ncbi:response regulator [Pseudobacteriovorax antillogorgiicola]|uniref:Hpt domain-containing protein n=1 Tax=Pseudobacteriovorax antillogorgiicola TaxID=1513793 RepID=A0A1Y6BYN0_9BACT|nr:response regulator [Pseudobacteriovorax antillogorgiicola]TCS51261.1 Hpt domain-containing protein [Pseudobacteriovorax antillogorgiicola]SMF36428.1 Hpt domain-containing protein [Pseudobacteriovorax antillogorgiicola]
MDFEIEIKREFLLEARELVEQAEEAFLDFERNHSDLTVIDNIFRLFHTLKGSGFTAGFDQLGNFTHKLENILSALKSREINVTPELCNTLIQSNDILSDWISDLQDDIDYFNPKAEALETELKSFLSESSSAPVSEVQKPSQAFGMFDDDEDSSENESFAAPQIIVPTPIKSTAIGRVLVVDDEPDIRELIQMYLEEINLEIITAGNGQEGLDFFKSGNKPDLVLSDLRMPQMDGLQFIGKLREIEPDIPVIFISGAAEREDIISFIELGAFNFIEKPITRQLLLHQVKNALSFRKTQESITKVSMLNFKVHMACYQLVRTKDQEKKAKLENEILALLEQISELNNEMINYKNLSVA